MSFLGDLRAVLAESGFRRLFATRLVSQAGDGVFNAAVGAYVFFSASSYPTPLAGAAAFTVLYVPYSVLGPFAGVFIDRWSRQRILVWSGAVRAVLIAATAALMASGDRGVPLYAAVLAVMGVSRFLDSALSAALPHVVPAGKLVTANSVAPTIGGVVSSAGGIAAFALNAAGGDTERGAAVTVLASGACYLAASLVATSMRRDLLGPRLGTGPARAPVLGELRAAAGGLAAGAAYLARRRDSRGALGATAAYGAGYGVLFLLMLILYRNYFYPSHVTAAAAHTGQLALVSAAGYACAAVVTPAAARRVPVPAWITVMLLAGAALTAGLGETFAQAGYLGAGFLLYLCKQSVAICAVTILQEDVEDAYRGRAFAFYDMTFNTTIAAGAGVFAPFMPANGRSPALVAVLAAAFAVAAAAYWLSAGRAPSRPTPSRSAQASSS